MCLESCVSCISNPETAVQFFGCQDPKLYQLRLNWRILMHHTSTALCQMPLHARHTVTGKSKLMLSVVVELTSSVWLLSCKGLQHVFNIKTGAAQDSLRHLSP